MTVRFVLASLAVLPAVANAQQAAPGGSSSAPTAAAPAPEARRESGREPKLNTYVGGFIALDLFKWVSVEGRRNETNFGIGTVNFDGHARFGGTRFKIKLDVDGALGTQNNLFEEAYVSHEFMPELAVTLGKGVVPFHQKHYGVITDSYVDNGSRLGKYYWNFGDQDRKLLLSVALGNKDMGFKNSLTVYGATEGQASRVAGEIETQQVDRADGAKDASRKPLKVDVPKPRDGLKGFDPVEQRGVANKVEVYWTKEFSTALSGLVYFNRLDPHLSHAVATSGKFEIKDELELWYEGQYGWSSAFKHSFKNKEEWIAQVGGEYYLDEMLSVLGNFEVAKFSFKEAQVKNPEAGKSPRTLDYDHATFVNYKGTLAKAELGAAIHFNERATLTNGVLYEVGAVKVNDVLKETERNALQLGSSFTFAF